ncbi:MAG: putative glycoside hydrolase [Acidimicrobiia bacterium]
MHIGRVLRRTTSKPAFALFLVGSFGLTACLNTSMVVVGETPAPAPPPLPAISVSVVDDAGGSMAGALVDFQGFVTETNAAGLASTFWEDEPIVVVATAPGFHESTAHLEEFSDDPIEIALRPVVLTGRVTDADGDGIEGAAVQLGDVTTTSGLNGAFRLERVVAGEALVTRPAWMPATATWDGTTDGLEIVIEPRMVKALHITGWTPRNEEAWSGLLALADTTEINALVVDLKDESGRVYYPSAVPLAEEVGATREFYHLADLVAEVEQHDLYMIGRLVTFQDPVAARARTDLAIVNTDGTPFEKNGQYFLDPTDPTVRLYALDLATEACRAGIDEIQFDYVRFPDGFGTSVRFDGGSAYLGAYNDPEAGAARVAVIAAFLQQARELLNPIGCAVSADVFAIILSVPDDQGIGQRTEDLSGAVDAISPMIYPDHYVDGSFGFETPFDHPSEVIDAALAAGIPRLHPTAIMRPWLADYYYGPSEVRAEIDAAEKYGIGWMLWNANSNHTPGALHPESSATTAE